MLLDLQKDITYLKGVGEKRAKCFKKLDVFNVEDLLYHFPRSYIDYSSPVAIKDAVINQNNVIEGTVVHKFSPANIRKGMVIYKALVTDDESEITVIIYNNEYLAKKLEIGASYIIYGKVMGNATRKEVSSPLIISADVEEKIQPVYHLTEGLSQYNLSSCIKNALAIFDNTIYEVLPKWIVKEYELCSFQYAIKNIHFPKDINAYNIAKRRLVFDEVFLLLLGMKRFKNNNRQTTSCKLKDINISDLYNKLPFELTHAQKRAINECLQDMIGNYPLNRLVQGDVGSGKTAVAAACCYALYKNGYQSALMAPTEILAVQHYNTLISFLKPLNVNICLLTGSLTSKQKAGIKEDIKLHKYDVIVGTHALVTDTTVFDNLGLVITDEQHRFGVNQRALLALKGENPHKLVMSATPIPRTLALMIYGDLDISVLDELPVGRQSIETYAVTGKLRERAYSFIAKHVKEGRQAYIVCPMIEDNENELQAATVYIEKLGKTCLNDFNIGLLHGKMSAADKDSIMTEFKSGQIQILVSTTVIEVGVDVPNAVIIMIENADRFGLSQLHQLRGRVGRGKFKSYCILVTDNTSEESKARLKILSKITDGFKISEEDLKMRGPGDFFGERQHGLPKFKIADLSSDTKVFKMAQDAAEKIIAEDNTLTKKENKPLKELVDKMFRNTIHD